MHIYIYIIMYIDRFIYIYIIMVYVHYNVSTGNQLCDYVIVRLNFEYIRQMASRD